MPRFRIREEKGINCPRCKAPTEMREHKVITSKILRQPFYYEKWYRCMNLGCRTKQINPSQFKIENLAYRIKGAEFEENERQQSFLKSIS